jgi:3-oxoacyl-[acyl-carrier-protein] synthase III
LLVFASGILRATSGLVANVGSETGSVYFDPLTVREDKSQLVNLVQMGDGAAAVVLGPPAGVVDRSMGIDLHEVDYVIPHQANGHMAALLARHLGIEAERVFPLYRRRTRTNAG